MKKCNVCDTCCQNYIPGGAHCDACVSQSCWTKATSATPTDMEGDVAGRLSVVLDQVLGGFFRADKVQQVTKALRSISGVVTPGEKDEISAIVKTMSLHSDEDTEHRSATGQVCSAEPMQVSWLWNNDGCKPQNGTGSVSIYPGKGKVQVAQCDSSGMNLMLHCELQPAEDCSGGGVRLVSTFSNTGGFEASSDGPIVTADFRPPSSGCSPVFEGSPDTGKCCFGANTPQFRGY